jgi:hypothetical protein
MARTGTFPLRLPLSLKAAVEAISERDGTSMNQFLVVAAAEKIAAMQTETFFAERAGRTNCYAFWQIVNHYEGEMALGTICLSEAAYGLKPPFVRHPKRLNNPHPNA